MNQILVLPDDYIEGNRILISGKRLVHIRRYFNPAPGSSLRAGLLNGLRGSISVKEINENSAVFEADFSLSPPAKLPLTLIIAMPRPKVLKRVVEHSTALGISRIYIIKTWRVEKSYWSTPLLSEESLFSFVTAGLEQSGDTVPPGIFIRKYFRPFFEDEAPSIIKGARALCAHPSGKREFPACAQGAVVLAIGPEGGFIPWEVDFMEKTGFEAVSGGGRILRVETAVPYFTGRLFAL